MAEAPSAELNVGPDDPAQPAQTTTLISWDDNSTWIALPASGNLWVGLEFSGAPSANVVLWHQGGSQTPVPPGFAVYSVGAGDMLMYQPSAPPTSMKLGWGYQ